MGPEERDDYSADIRFGEWLRSRRLQKGLSVEVSAKLAELSVRRLKGLEMGLSGRGITRPEAARLGLIYDVAVTDIIERASER